MELIISIDLKSEFGFLKKPDLNTGIYLTFNMLHKPALLGILGAIAGLEGYKEKDKFPEYYLKLKNLKIAIKPINSDKGNYKKTIIKYTNSVGYANKDGTLIVDEQTLIQPAYRCYIKLDRDNELFFQLMQYLENKNAEYLPYLGKNEFSLWWDNFQAYEAEAFKFDEEYQIASIFNKNDLIIKEARSEIVFDILDRNGNDEKFIYFERLPVAFDKELKQYHFEEFVYTNYKIKKDSKLNNLYHLQETNEVIQLF